MPYFRRANVNVYAYVSGPNSVGEEKVSEVTGDLPQDEGS
jgi:hypothetical protein